MDQVKKGMPNATEVAKTQLIDTKKEAVKAEKALKAAPAQVKTEKVSEFAVKKGAEIKGAVKTAPKAPLDAAIGSNFIA